MDSEEGTKIYNITEEIKGYQKEIAKLKQENKRLKENWNKLRDYLFDIRHRAIELQILADIHNTEPTISVIMILDKMEELERGINK